MQKMISVCLILSIILTLVLVYHTNSIVFQDHDSDFDSAEIAWGVSVFAVTVIAIECDIFLSVRYFVLYNDRRLSRLALNTFLLTISSVFLVSVIITILTKSIAFAIFITPIVMIWAVICMILRAAEYINSFKRRINGK